MNMMARLVDAHGRSFPLYEKPTRIGRNADNQVVLTDSEVSRHHATIFAQGGQLFLRDENSKNGTRLNDQRITGTHPLKIGDKVRIGRTEFVVQVGTSAQAGSAPGTYMPPRRSPALPYAIIGIATLATIFLLLVVITLNQRQPTPQAVVVPTAITPSAVMPSPTTLATASPSPVAPSASVTPAGPTATIESPSFPALVPPLADVSFPSTVVAYPSDWPPELRYPDQFKLVGSASGTLPDGKTKGWSAKLVYSGRTENAKTDLSSFFIGRGWRIVESSQLDSDGWHLFLQRNNNSQRGSVLIGPDVVGPGSAKLLVTIFL